MWTSAYRVIGRLLFLICPNVSFMNFPWKITPRGRQFFSATLDFFLKSTSSATREQRRGFYALLGSSWNLTSRFYSTRPNKSLSNFRLGFGRTVWSRLQFFWIFSELFYFNLQRLNNISSWDPIQQTSLIFLQIRFTCFLLILQIWKSSYAP